MISSSIINCIGAISCSEVTRNMFTHPNDDVVDDDSDGDGDGDDVSMAYRL